jgi:ribosome-associated protein
MIKVSSRVSIPFSELDFRASRSSGPGGQNVNKVNSKVTLRWDPVHSEALPDELRQRFLQTYASRLTRGGEVLIQSDRFRDQAKNKADCLAKLQALLRAVAQPPKRRRPTRLSKAKKEARLSEKKQRSSVKAARTRKTDWDD